VNYQPKLQSLTSVKALGCDSQGSSTPIHEPTLHHAGKTCTRPPRPTQSIATQ